MLQKKDSNKTNEKHKRILVKTNQGLNRIQSPNNQMVVMSLVSEWHGYRSALELHSNHLPGGFPGA